MTTVTETSTRKSAKKSSKKKNKSFASANIGSPQRPISKRQPQRQYESLSDWENAS